MAITTFVAGDVLTAAQLNGSFTTAGGLQFIKAQTIGNAVSSVTVSSAFSATYDNYRIIVNGGASSASIEDLNMTLGSTSAGYYWAQNGRTYANADSSAAGSNTSSWRAGNTSSDAINMCTDVFSPFLADQTSFSTVKSFAATNGAFYSGGGYLNDATSYTAFTLTPNSGTLTGGTIRVYGYRNS